MNKTKQKMLFKLRTIIYKRALADLKKGEMADLSRHKSKIEEEFNINFINFCYGVNECLC